MSYLYETHLHTSETSSCGKVSADDLVDIYKKGGYSGIVVTDHFTSNSFDIADWPAKIDLYLKGYRAAKAHEDENFKVLLGMELRFAENSNDYLLYGITEDFLYHTPDFNKLDLPSFRAIAQEHGVLIIQAHPFRNRITIVDPKQLDGIEIYNGNRRHENRNSIAKMWSQLHRLRQLSGSDFHQLMDSCLGGIFTETPIADEKELAETIRAGRYTCKPIK